MATISSSAMTALSVTAPPTTTTSTAMDPRLQRFLVRRRLGFVKAASASTSADEVAVIARVSNVAQWEGLSEVLVGANLGQDANGNNVVTGRIPVRRIEQVRTQPFVKSLKAAQLLHPALDATLTETEARPSLLPATSLSIGGAGVVIGIVDFGCDFVHQNFRLPGGGTRLLCIWDQNGPTTSSSPFGYGRKYSRDEINDALQEPDPYHVLGYAPDPDVPLRPKGTHGTHVMDIAAGNGRGSNVPGVAPEADLIFVELAASDVPWTGSQVVGRSLGDSVQLLEALKLIFDEAGDRPCVVNLSLGTNGGPHDGTTLVEQGIDALIGGKPNRAVVIAASNSFEDGIHAAGNVPDNGSFDLRWQVFHADATHNELEVWYSGQDRLTVELLTPDGTGILTVAPGQTDGLQTPSGDVAVLVVNRLNDPNNSDNVINVFLESGVPTGTWVVRLKGDQVTNGAFHAWIERDDSSPSRFAPPHDNTYTIGSISCGRQTIAVGSYDGHKTSQPLSWFSSAGPTRDGREKPEVSAPGHDVLAAWSRTKTAVVRKSGTSMAAPAVAGIVALALAEAVKRGTSLSNDQIRQLVKQASRRNPPPGTSWHDRYGHGRLSARATVQAVIDLAEGGGDGAAQADERARPKKPVRKKTRKARQ